MKKTLVALAALASVSAFAQSTVTLSGSASVGLMNTGAANASTTAAHLGNGANAINFNSVEDLGGGLKSGFDAQIRYNIGTGDINSKGTGNAFFHNANVYLSSATLGTVRAGKIAEASNCAFDPWACTGGAGLAGAEGLSNLVGAGTTAAAVGYTTPTFAGFSLGFVTSQQARNSERNLTQAKYENGPVAVQYLIVKSSANAVSNGTDSSATYTAPTDVGGKDTSLAASYDLQVVKLIASSNISKDAAGLKTKSVNTLALTAPLGAKVTLLAGYNKASHIGTTYTSANDSKAAVGVNYALSKRTTLGADVFKAEAAGAGTGYVVRMAHTF